MGRSKTTYKNIDTVVEKIMAEYIDDIRKNIDVAAKKVAKKGALALKNDSAQFTARWGTGKYQKGWRVTEEQHVWFKSYVIHNAKSPVLTHLLEYGHQLEGVYNGHVYDGSTRTEAFPHITPVAKKVVDEFERSVKSAIQRS